MLKADFHTHTADDPVDRVPYTTRELIERAFELEYDVLAVTLHDRQLPLGRDLDYAASLGIVLMHGIERTIEGKHVLLVNFSRASERVNSFVDLARLRHDEPGLVIAPHPFFPGRMCLGRTLDRHAELFDAIEWNAMFTRRVNFNAPAVRWAERHGKPVVGNADVHRLWQLGTCYSLVEAALDADAICAAVRAGQVSFRAEPLPTSTAARTMRELFTDDIRRMVEPRLQAARRLLDWPATDLL
jgi:predicted metal-dependent phosphoesterase TrpH